MMKLVKFTGLTLVSILALSAIAPTALAATTTEGEGVFEISTDTVTPVKPGTDIEIEPENPITAEKVSNVQLIHVPAFDFGLNDTTMNDKEYSVLNAAVKKKTETDLKEIPQFVQVADVSGKTGTPWEVTAEQDAVFASNAATPHKLTNTRIRFYGTTATNNVRNDKVADMITELTLGGSGYTALPVKTVDAGPISIIKSKAAVDVSGTTNGTITSLVFQDAYDEANFDTVVPPLKQNRAKNEDVKLAVPQTDGVQAAEYSADIVWTLTAGP